MRKAFYRFLITAAAGIMLSAATAFSALAMPASQSYDEFSRETNLEDFTKEYSLNIDPDFNPKGYDYFYYNWSSKISVGDDNTVDVSEVIDVYFNSPGKDIVRVLPLYSNTAVENNIITMNNISIGSIACDKGFSKHYKGDLLEIALGSAGSAEPVYNTGIKRYTVHYRYELGRDPIKNLDELYFNIFGIATERPVLRCQFEIKLPKDFDRDKAMILMNGGSDRGDILTYTISDNTVYGETSSHIDSGTVIAFKALLPEGYFSNAEAVYDYSALISLGATGLLLIICTVIYLKCYRRCSFFKTIERKPPDGINSLEAAYIKKGRINDRNIISLLLYLLNKGCVSVAALTKGTQGSSASNNTTGYVFKRKKGTGFLKADEKAFLNGLFENADRSFSDTPAVMDVTLRNRFFKTLDSIRDYAESGSGSYRGYFAPLGRSIKRIYTVIVMLFSVLIIALPLSFNGAVSFERLDFAMLAFMGFILIIPQFIAAFFGKFIRAIIYGLMALMILSTALWSTELDLAQKIALLVGGASVCTAGYTGVYIDKLRTKAGETLFARIVSFEEQFRTDLGKNGMTDDELCELAYELLPFAYSLDLMQAWDKRFIKIIEGRPPRWFETTDEYTPFNIRTLSLFMTGLTQDIMSRPRNAERNKIAQLLS